MLQVRFDGHKYKARLSIDERDRVRRVGFVWDKIEKVWSTHDPKVAYRLLEFCDDTTKSTILQYFDLLPQVAPSIVTNVRDKVPFKHQIEGAQWVLTRRSSYLAFEAGTGKTAIAPICLNTDDGPTIIVCPSFLKYNWENELDEWLKHFHTIQVFKSSKDKMINADIYIVPDSLLSIDAFRQQFFDSKIRFKYLFIDEAHRFKSVTAKRTMSLVGVRRIKISKRTVKWTGFHKIADRVICLSGTPMPNRPVELFALIYNFAHHALNFFDRHTFGVRYCGGFQSEWGWDYNGASNLDELNSALTRNYMLVKKTDDCLDLPEALPSEFIFLEDTRTNSLIRKEMHLLDTLKVTDIIKSETVSDPAFKKRVEEKLEENPEVGGFGFISELRKMLGLRKVSAAVDVISEMLETFDQIVVFCWHKEVVSEIVEGLQEHKPLKITGDILPLARTNLVKKFQTDSSHRIIVANIQAAGVGFTLTKSSCVVFVEPSWTPSDNDQAIRRCRRIGQTKPVHSFFLVVKNSLDHLVLNAHQNKNTVIQKVVK